jgi:hypothetical protein
MIKLLKLDANFGSSDCLEKRINIFLDEIRKENKIIKVEIKIDGGFLYVIVVYSKGLMVY